MVSSSPPLPPPPLPNRITCFEYCFIRCCVFSAGDSSSHTPPPLLHLILPSHFPVVLFSTFTSSLRCFSRHLHTAGDRAIISPPCGLRVNLSDNGRMPLQRINEPSCTTVDLLWIGLLSRLSSPPPPTPPFAYEVTGDKDMRCGVSATLNNGRANTSDAATEEDSQMERGRKTQARNRTFQDVNSNLHANHFVVFNRIGCIAFRRTSDRQ